MQAQLTGKS